MRVILNLICAILEVIFYCFLAGFAVFILTVYVLSLISGLEYLQILK